MGDEEVKEVKEKDNTKDTESEIEVKEKEPEPKKNAQSEAIDRINQIYNDKLAKIEEEKASSKAKMDKLAEGKEAEIELLAKKEQARADMETELLKKDKAVDKLSFDIDSINNSRKYGITKKENLLKDKTAKEKKKGELEDDIKADKKAIEEADKQLEELKAKKDEKTDKDEEDKTEKSDKSEEEKEEVTEESITKTKEEKQKDMEEKEKELEAIPDKIKEIDKQIEDLDKQLADWEKEVEKAKEELEQLKSEQFSDRQKLEEMQEEDNKSEPGWYAKYKEEKARFDSMSSQIDSVTKEKEDISKTVSESEKNDGEDPDTIIEEAKVENALKSAPVLKDINKDTIGTYLNYNPKTGEQYKEGEEKESSNLLINNIDNLVTDENMDKVKEAVAKLKGNDTITKIDNFISGTKFEKNPITIVLDTIESGDKDKIKSVITSFIEKYSSDEARRENPVIYAVGNMVFSTLGDMLNTGDKGEMQASTTAEMETGGFASSMLATIENMEGWKSVVDKVGKEKLEDSKNNVVKKMASNFTESGKMGLEGINGFVNAHNIKKETEEMKKSGDANADKYMRIMSGARKASMSNGATTLVKTAGNVAQGFATSFLGEKAGKAVSLGITIGTAIINKLIGKKFETSQRNEVLNSAYALGGVQYNEKLVKEEKFNQILKKVSGITSKEKLYGAIKTVDAISLHAAMRKSYQKPDHTADRALTNLGISDRSVYPKISVYDIMKRSGHEPTGGDWRQELKDSMVVDGKDYPSAASVIKGGLKKVGKSALNGVKSAWSWVTGKVSNLFSKKNDKEDDDEIALEV